MRCNYDSSTDRAQARLHPHSMGDREVARAPPLGRRPSRGRLQGDARTVQQRRKIFALTEELGWNGDPRRIQGFAKRLTGVDRLEWLNVAQCEKVIEGLKAMVARQKRKEAQV